jgi:hypothetical protein
LVRKKNGRFIYISVNQYTAGQWTQCIASIDNEQWNIVNGGYSKSTCQKLAKECLGRNAESIWHSSPVVINAPYKNCAKKLSGKIKDKPTIPSVSEFPKHLKWVLDHEGKRSEIQDYLDMDEVNKIRNLYIHEQKHNLHIQKLIERISYSKLISTLKELGIVASPDYLPERSPVSGEAFDDLSWCIHHEGVRTFTDGGIKHRKPELVQREAYQNKATMVEPYLE